MRSSGREPTSTQNGARWQQENMERTDSARAIACAEALPPGLKSDFGDGEVGVAEQRYRPLDPAGDEIAVGRDAEGFLEASGEVGLGDAAHAGKPLDGPLFVRGGVHPVFGAEQATEEVGGWPG